MSSLSCVIIYRYMWDVLVIQTDNILNIKRLRQESHQRLCVCAWARVYVLEYIFKSVNVKCRINEIQSTKLDVIRTISVCFYKSLRSRRIKPKTVHVSYLSLSNNNTEGLNLLTTNTFFALIYHYEANVDSKTEQNRNRIMKPLALTLFLAQYFSFRVY